MANCGPQKNADRPSGYGEGFLGIDHEHVHAKQDLTAGEHQVARRDSVTPLIYDEFESFRLSVDLLFPVLWKKIEFMCLVDRRCGVGNIEFVIDV